ncbi:MAG: DUF177 domain-containing protein [Bacteroidaceae bacterium]|nr:DUF177 domain-containing protein [Bacteroidaceae bacterium]
MSIVLDLRQDFKQAVETEYSVDDKMLRTIEKSLVKGGQFTVRIKAQQAAKGLSLDINISGNAIVECDRCLDDMETPVNTSKTLAVQFADRYEDADEVVYVPEEQTELDLWPMVYDFIALAIPLTHVHPEGQCNKEMAERLSQYMVGNEPETTL